MKIIRNGIYLEYSYSYLPSLTYVNKIKNIEIKFGINPFNQIYRKIHIQKYGPYKNLDSLRIRFLKWNPL